MFGGVQLTEILQNDHQNGSKYTKTQNSVKCKYMLDRNVWQNSVISII